MDAIVDTLHMEKSIELMMDEVQLEMQSLMMAAEEELYCMDDIWHLTMDLVVVLDMHEERKIMD